MRGWTRASGAQMPDKRLRHIVYVDARKHPELAELLWEAEFGAKSDLMVSLMEAGRRQLLRGQSSKRGTRSSPTVSGPPPSVVEQQVHPNSAEQAALTQAPSPPELPDQAGKTHQATEPSETPPPDLGVLKAFLE
jgi:hypothetical protein